MLLPTYPPNQSDTESYQLYPPHCSDPPFLLSSRSLASVWPFASHLVSWSLYQSKPCLEPQSEPCPQIADQRECSDLRILPLLDWASEQKLSSGTATWSPDLGAGDGLWLPGQLTLSIFTEAGVKFVQREIRPSGGNRSCLLVILQMRLLFSFRLADTMIVKPTMKGHQRKRCISRTLRGGGQGAPSSISVPPAGQAESLPPAP